MGARFYPSETTVAYLDVLQRHVSSHGRPVSLYSDRYGVFTTHKEDRDTPTQFAPSSNAKAKAKATLSQG